MGLDERKQAALKGHHACPGCGSMTSISEKDGKDCGGMPGITYKVCGGCGYARAKLPRKRRPKLS